MYDWRSNFPLPAVEEDIKRSLMRTAHHEE
jgi:hypothetical protein